MVVYGLPFGPRLEKIFSASYLRERKVAVATNLRMKWDFRAIIMPPILHPVVLVTGQMEKFTRPSRVGSVKMDRALFPIMPYPYLAKADIEDVYSVIAYIKTLPMLKRSYPEPESDFPMNFIINLIPAKADHQPALILQIK